MRYEEMIEQVQQRASLGSEADAEAALTATLAALGERLDARSARSVGDQLPEQLATYLRRSRPTGGEANDAQADRR